MAHSRRDAGGARRGSRDRDWARPRSARPDAAGADAGGEQSPHSDQGDTVRRTNPLARPASRSYQAARSSPVRYPYLNGVRPVHTGTAEVRPRRGGNEWTDCDRISSSLLLLHKDRAFAHHHPDAGALYRREYGDFHRRAIGAAAAAAVCRGRSPDRRLRCVSGGRRRTCRHVRPQLSGSGPVDAGLRVRCSLSVSAVYVSARGRVPRA